MAKVFISYRRTDSAATSGRIYDRLVARFKRKNIFKDVDDIPAGVHFGSYIQDTLRECAVMLVVIGRQWLDTWDPEGSRRLDDPADWVRVEIETALSLGVTVIPLLVEGASMPRADQLPASLRELPTLNALPVRDDPDFSHDMERVIVASERAMAARPASRLGIFRRGTVSRPIPPPVPEQPVQTDESAQPTQPDPVPAPITSPVTGAVAKTLAPLKQRQALGKKRARGIALAVVAIVLIVASLGVLLSRGVIPVGADGRTNQRPTKTAGAAATTQQFQTATAAPTTIPRTYQGKLPLVAAAPGYGCEQGRLDVFWERPEGWSTSFCHGAFTHLTAAFAGATAIKFNFSNKQANVRIPMPANFTISLSISNLSANGWVEVTSAQTSDAGSVTYQLHVASSGLALSRGICAPHANCSSQSFDLGAISNSAHHTLTFSFHGNAFTPIFDGISYNSFNFDTASSLSIESFAIQLDGYLTPPPSVDVSDFTIAA